MEVKNPHGCAVHVCCAYLHCLQVFASIQPSNPDYISRSDLINIGIDPEGVEMVWELFDKNDNDEVRHVCVCGGERLGSVALTCARTIAVILAPACVCACVCVGRGHQ